MTFTQRQRFVLRAALRYAADYLHSLNDSMADYEGEEGIKVDGEKGRYVSDEEVESLAKQFGAGPEPRADGLRAFRGTFLVAIDPDDTTDEEPLAVTRDGLIEFLKDTLFPEIDLEANGNPVGFQSAELLFDTLEELPADEVSRLYGK